MTLKNAMIKMVKSRMFLVSLVLMLVLVLIDVLPISIGILHHNSKTPLSYQAIQSAGFQFISMLKIVPPIFLLIGLLDIWVPRETMIRLMGDNSGWLGVFIAFFIGTMSAGPLIAAFPVAHIMLKKGARYAYVLFFLMTWASAKLPILFFQATTLGLPYTIITNVTLIIVYLIGTNLIDKYLSSAEKKRIYQLAENTL